MDLGFAIFSMKNGRLYSVGKNEYSELGIVTKTHLETNIQEITGLKNHKIINIASEHNHSLAMNNYGKIFS